MRQPARAKITRSKFVYEPMSQINQVVPTESFVEMDGVTPATESESGDAVGGPAPQQTEKVKFEARKFFNNCQMCLHYVYFG